MNDLVINLLQTLKSRKISIQDFSEATGIPSDRIYKWRQKGTNPKAEDQATIRSWLEGNFLDKGQISRENNQPLMDVDNATLLRILDNLSAAHKEISQSNNKLAENEQMILLKIPSIENADRYTLSETTWTVQGLREFFEEIAAKVRNAPLLDIQQELNNKVMKAKKGAENTGIHVDVSKKSI